MQTVYLGLFSSIFEWIYNKILKPIVDWLGGLLNTVFTWIFDKILKPLLVDVLLPLFKMLVQLIFDILASLIYSIFAELLKIIDTIQVIFNVFAGVEPVTYDKANYYMLDLFFSNRTVWNTVLFMTIMSFALMLVFSLIAVLRSMADMSGEMKNPVSKVLRLTFQCFIKMIMIPVVCLLLVRLSGVILVGVNNGIQAAQKAGSKSGAEIESQSTIARVIFCMSSMNAAQNPAYNMNSGKASVDDDLRGPYYYGTKSYDDTGLIKKDFKYEKFNYVIGFGVGLIFLSVLVTCIFKFINRIFNVVMLYISSPL
ncbi:MAG: hypothetical protein IJ600_08070, partial [Lachnospiraceae bacterium]|nr:hypothetical protein [Lachnospiraceae bacterium]